MVAMSTLDLLTTTQVNTQRSTEKCQLNIMRHNRIATKNHLHIASTNQIRNIATCPSMDYLRTKHKKYLPTMLLRLLHLTCNLVNRQHLHFFRGHITLHKGKPLTFTGTLKGLHTNAFRAYHHFVPDLHLVHGLTVGTL